MESKEIVKHEARPLVRAQDDPIINWLDVDRFNHIQRVAEVFARSEMVPDHFRGKVANCIIAVQMAFRMNIDPMLTMQHCYVVHGKPAFDTQFLIALVNQSRVFSGPIQWRWAGMPINDDWTCTAYAIHAETGQACESSISWAQVKAEGWPGRTGSKWNTIPEQMFRWRTAAWLIRLHCPEKIMGMPPIDEIEDIGPTQTLITECIPNEIPLADPANFEVLPAATAETEPTQALQKESNQAAPLVKRQIIRIYFKADNPPPEPWPATLEQAGFELSGSNLKPYYVAHLTPETGQLAEEARNEPWEPILRVAEVKP